MNIEIIKNDNSSIVGVRGSDPGSKIFKEMKEMKEIFTEDLAHWRRLLLLDPGCIIAQCKLRKWKDVTNWVRKRNMYMILWGL